MKAPTGFRPATQRTRPQIESDTPIVPRAIMEAICEEAAVWLGQPLPRRWIRELTAHANTVYAHNARFRQSVRARGDKGRDYLWAFVRHWLAGLLWERRRHIHACLPAAYNCGDALPPKEFIAPHQLKTVRKNPAPIRLRSRPAPDYAFAAAAHFHSL